MAGNRSIHNHIFYDNVSSTDETSTSTMRVESDESTMMLEFSCDDVVSAKVYGDIFGDGGFKQLPVFKYPSIDLIVDNITDQNCFYVVDITGVDYVKVILNSVSNPVTVRAKVVG